MCQTNEGKNTHHVLRHKLKYETRVLSPALDGFLDEWHYKPSPRGQVWGHQNGIHHQEKISCGKLSYKKKMFSIKTEITGIKKTMNLVQRQSFSTLYYQTIKILQKKKISSPFC